MTIQDIAFLIPTLERPLECQDTIDRIRKLWPDALVYVADDSEDVTMFDGCINVKVTEDCGVSAKRNALIKQARQEFIFLLDDDMKLDHVDLVSLVQLVKDEGFTIAGVRKMDIGRDRWSNSEGDFFVNGKQLHINRPTRKQHYADLAGQTGSHIECMVVDYMPMCFLAKRSLFHHVLFDERLKTCGEHADFFMRVAAANGHIQLDERHQSMYSDSEIKKHGTSPLAFKSAPGQLKACIHLDSYVVDTGSRPAVSYNQKRRRGGSFRRQMMANWNFTKIIRWNSRVKAKAIY